jgi:hypothetical protein
MLKALTNVCLWRQSGLNATDQPLAVVVDQISGLWQLRQCFIRWSRLRFF